MKRIMIIGASGSGKTTLARALGATLDVPIIHGDHFYFDAGWVLKSKHITQDLFVAAALTDAWVFDGNHSASMDMRAERADVIIYLQVNKWRRFMRTMWRSMLFYRRNRPDMAEGCLEQFDPRFHFDWVLGHDKRSKSKMDWFADTWQGRKPVLRFSSVKEINRFLRNPQSYVDQQKPETSDKSQRLPPR
jgi:adenylate kinase family enzyme